MRKRANLGGLPGKPVLRSFDALRIVPLSRLDAARPALRRRYIAVQLHAWGADGRGALPVAVLDAQAFLAAVSGGR